MEKMTVQKKCRHRSCRIFSLLWACLFICLVFAGCGSSENQRSPAFDAILKKQNIRYSLDHTGDIEISAFVKEVEPGCIILEEYQYQGDVVSRVTRNEYYDTTRKTADEMEGLKSNIDYVVNEVNRHPGFFAMASQQGNSYVCQVVLSGLNDPYAFERVRREGILVMLDDNADHMSFQVMRGLLLGEGYTEN